MVELTLPQETRPPPPPPPPPLSWRRGVFSDETHGFHPSLRMLGFDPERHKAGMASADLGSYDSQWWYAK